MTSMDNTPDSPAKTPEGYTTQGGNFWTLITPEIWKVLHAVLHEAEYLADCVRRTPETYRGWWRFCDLPNGYAPDDWLNPGIDHEELFDPNMALAKVAEKLHEQTFDDWKPHGVWEEIEAHDRASIDETIRYWRNEQAAGESYYGDENEAASIP